MKIEYEGKLFGKIAMNFKYCEMMNENMQLKYVLYPDH